MINRCDWYTNLFKHNVLQEYRPGVYGSGFKPLAKRFKIKGGHKLIMHWYCQWDGTVESLNRKSKGDQPRTMTKKEVKLYILDFVNMMNSQYKPVSYKMVQLHVEASLVGVDYWYEIAKFRKFLQRIGNDKLIFIDGLAIYATMLPHRTLVAPGHQELIIVDKLSAYAERYDFIGAINGSQAIACMNLTPTDRKNRNVKGFRKEVVNDWIVNVLAPAINRLCINNMYLICDRSQAHNKANMMEALKAGRCYSVVDIYYMPAASAKYISPLDNPTWDVLREVLRKQHPLTTINLTSLLSQTFDSLSKQQIRNAYRKCAITYRTDVYYDQPSI